jgi:two-component system sensor histidine kinase CiaH
VTALLRRRSGTAGATHLPDVRRQSLRVALAATAIVGLVYLVVAVAVVALVTKNLTDQVDTRLSEYVAHNFREPAPGGGKFEPGPGDRPYEAPILVWGIQTDGTIFTSSNAASIALPANYQKLRGSTSATLSGGSFRLLGVPALDGTFVVGQSLTSVTGSQATVLLAELAIAPVLLGIVFLGAVAIGRRVATPVELARRKQLEFTADASHELRTPLSVIEANTSLALSHPRNEEWYRTAFERVDNESKRMRRLLEDMLWLARFDATQGSPNAEPVDVGVLATATADRFGAVAEARQLTLAVEPAAPNSVISVPPEWLDRLLGVLLDNACKFSAEGGTVRIAVTSEGGRVQLTVDDSGPGIADEERARIFDRFHRASETKSGAGLGLAIADAIVRATDGRWKVGSSASGGASMSVSWPRAFAGPRETATRRAPQRTEAPG